MQLFKLQLVEININCRCRGSSLSEKESLCKTVKWHRVPVLSHRWWISVHHAEQGMSRPVRRLAKEGRLVVYDNRGVADGYIIVSKFMQKYDLLIRCVTVPVSVDSTFVLYIFTLLVMFLKA